MNCWQNIEFLNYFLEFFGNFALVFFGMSKEVDVIVQEYRQLLAYEASTQ